MSEWITKDLDLRVAQDILSRHLDEFEDDIGVQEVIITPEGSFTVERSDWVVEMEERFQHLYGEYRGSDVTRRVVSHFLTDGEHVH